jgi:hypothetical protein
MIGLHAISVGARVCDPKWPAILAVSKSVTDASKIGSSHVSWSDCSFSKKHGCHSYSDVQPFKPPQFVFDEKVTFKCPRCWGVCNCSYVKFFMPLLQRD